MLDSNGKLINAECRIETVNFCNGACTICSHDKMTRPKGIMSDLFFKELVTQAKKMEAKLISPFGFGEPLFDPTLKDKIQICTNFELETFITTNGSLCFRDRILSLFDAGLNHLRISVHAITQENYSKIHLHLNWDQLITNIFYILQMKYAFPNIRVSIIVIPMHGESVDQVKNFWEKTFGIEDIEIWKAHNWGETKNYRRASKKKLKTCGRPFRGPIQIEWDGTIIPCCFLTDNELTLGNVKGRSLKDVLLDYPYQELREKHEIGDLKGLPCESCDQRFIEEQPVLLYSKHNPDCNINKTSSLNFDLIQE